MKNKVLFLITFALLVLMPFSVNAESNKNYNMMVKKLEEFLCQEVQGHELYVSMQTYNKVAVYDETTDKEYLIDFSNIGVCKEYTEEIETDSERYEYSWDGNNLYLETYKSDLLFSHAKTLDTTIEPDSSYAELKQDGFYHVNNPTVENLSNYYEMYYFELATAAYNQNETYYEIKTYQYSLNNYDGDYTLATKKELDATTYETNKYYVIAKPTKKDLIGQFNSDTFVVPKDKSGLTSDINLSKYDFRNHFELGGKTYYVFINLETGDRNFAIFDENGDYQTFGLNNLIPITIDNTDDNKYLSLLAKVDNKNHLILLDDNLNRIVLIDVSEYGDNISFIGYNNSDFYYLVHSYGDDNILEINYTNSNSFYTVTFDANGGAFKKEKTIIIDKWQVGMEENLEIPTRDGYKFLGFYTGKTDGTKLEMILAESGIDSDMTFYAHWEKIEDVPNTLDNVSYSIIMIILSIIGFVVATMYLNKNSKRA